MGTKRTLAPIVASVIGNGSSGPLLDLFSGVCAVGSAVATDRQIWCNDVQVFAATIASAFFTSSSCPLTWKHAAEAAHCHFLKNRKALHNRYFAALQDEKIALESRALERIQILERKMPNVARSTLLDTERSQLAISRYRFPFRLFTITYSGSYLGLSQSIQVDSIRYALDELRNNGELSNQQHEWLCLALCKAVGKVATTTGHFAQHMRVKKNTVSRFVAQRRRDVWSEWLKAISELSPIGTRSWRSRNRVFNQDAAELLRSLLKRGESPAVVYADPPYTSDQYSRYYHLYETLLLYDYPKSEFTGRYRPDRFSSPYSKKREVASAMEELIASCAKLGSRLVLSYPERGLLPDSRNAIEALFRRYFGNSLSVMCLDHYHSSLGGSKGHQMYRVKEFIFSAG